MVCDTPRSELAEKQAVMGAVVLVGLVGHLLQHSHGMKFQRAFSENSLLRPSCPSPGAYSKGGSLS